MNRFEQYQICKERGEHVSDGSCYTTNPPMSKCKFCATLYRYETNLIEIDPPQGSNPGFDNKGVTTSGTDRTDREQDDQTSVT